MISLVTLRTKFTSVFGSTSGLNTWFTGTVLTTDVVYEQTMIVTFLLNFYYIQINYHLNING